MNLTLSKNGFLTRKTMCKPARCSGCLKPGAINITDFLRNNMHPLKFLVIKKDPLFGTLSQEEIINVKLEDFKIQGMQNVEL